jgi:hypothetical protein
MLSLEPSLGLPSKHPRTTRGSSPSSMAKPLPRERLTRFPDDEIQSWSNRGLDEPVRRQELYELEQRIFERKQKMLDEVIGGVTSQARAFTMSRSTALGAAPTTRSTTAPSLKNTIVGMDWIA